MSGVSRSCLARSSNSVTRTEAGSMGRPQLGFPRRRIISRRSAALAAKIILFCQTRLVISLDPVAAMVSTSKGLAVAIAIELGTSFVDNQRLPVVDPAVQLANSILRLHSSGHLDECKSARFAGVAIRDNRDGLNFPVDREQCSNLVFGSGKIQIANIDVCHVSPHAIDRSLSLRDILTQSTRWGSRNTAAATPVMRLSCCSTQVFEHPTMGDDLRGAGERQVRGGSNEETDRLTRMLAPNPSPERHCFFGFLSHVQQY